MKAVYLCQFILADEVKCNELYQKFIERMTWKYLGITAFYSLKSDRIDLNIIVQHSDNSKFKDLTEIILDILKNVPDRTVSTLEKI